MIHDALPQVRLVDNHLLSLGQYMEKVHEDLQTYIILLEMI